MLGWTAAAVTAVATPAAIVLDRRSRRAGRIAKMVAATGFVVVAATVEAWSTSFGLLILVGLTLSWVGDLALTYRGTRPFVVGLVAFLVAHVAYAAGFVVRGVAPGGVAIGAVAAAVLAVRIVPWLLPRVDRSLRIPVGGYVVAISAMLMAAIGAFAAAPDWRVAVGAAMFYASDVFVARERFVSPGAANRAIGLPLYFGGQLLLAWAAGG